MHEVLVIQEIFGVKTTRESKLSEYLFSWTINSDLLVIPKISILNAYDIPERNSKYVTKCHDIMPFYINFGSHSAIYIFRAMHYRKKLWGHESATTSPYIMILKWASEKCSQQINQMTSKWQFPDLLKNTLEGAKFSKCFYLKTIEHFSNFFLFTLRKPKL